MAKEKFSFEELAELNRAKYLKQFCKPVHIKKATAGIFLSEYKLKGKKEKILFLPFKKYTEALVLYNQIKKDKEHILKKVALVLVDSNKTEINCQVKKGGLSGPKLDMRATVFFESNFKLKFASTVATDAELEEGEGEETKKEAEAGIDDKRMASYDKMDAGVDKMKGAVGKMDTNKLEANLAKYTEALVVLEKEAMADGKIKKEERQRINTLKKGIKEIEKALNVTMGSKSKKITPERREKINQNLQKMKASLEKIVNALT